MRSYRMRSPGSSRGYTTSRLSCRARAAQRSVHRLGRQQSSVRRGHATQAYSRIAAAPANDGLARCARGRVHARASSARALLARGTRIQQERCHAFLYPLPTLALPSCFPSALPPVPVSPWRVILGLLPVRVSLLAQVHVEAVQRGLWRDGHGNRFVSARQVDATCSTAVATATTAAIAASAIASAATAFAAALDDVRVVDDAARRLGRRHDRNPVAQRRDHLCGYIWSNAVAGEPGDWIGPERPQAL